MAENEREAEEKMSDKEEIVFCKGGGCTAKLGPGILARVLEKIPKTRDENLMIGYDSSDDAAVYKLTDDLAVVQTLDFFPPMVDDPYTFGQIAAANALSDIYAMGGDVKTALNIVCFPENWDLNILGQIMLGGGPPYHSRLRFVYGYIFRFPFRDGRRPPAFPFPDGRMRL